MSELKDILSQPYQVWDENHMKHNLLSDSDTVTISWLKNDKFVHSGFKRKTLAKLGLCVNKSGEWQEADLRALNGGSRENSGRPEKSEDEKMVAFSMTDHPEIIKGFGGLDKYRKAVRQFTKEHTNLNRCICLYGLSPEKKRN
jgi:hypothetical protein